MTAMASFTKVDLQQALAQMLQADLRAQTQHLAQVGSPVCTFLSLSSTHGLALILWPLAGTARFCNLPRALAFGVCVCQELCCMKLVD